METEVEPTSLVEKSRYFNRMDEAFGILRRASQNRNVKLRDVAAAVIARFTGHEPATAPAFRTGGASGTGEQARLSS